MKKDQCDSNLASAAGHSARDCQYPNAVHLVSGAKARSGKCYRCSYRIRSANGAIT